jgi:hypothetical protein
MTTIVPSNVNKYVAISLSSNQYSDLPEFTDLVGERKGKKVTVTASTFDALKETNEVILKILGTHCAPDGIGNNIVALYGSGGRSFYRRKMALANYDKDASVQVKARRWIQFGGMNCGDINAIAFAEMQAEKHSRPLLLVKDNECDHGYVLSGDPRDPKWGERNTVVVDAYPAAPCAHTLDEAIEAKPASERPVEQYSPGAPIFEFSIEEEVKKNRVSTEEVDEFAKGRGYPEVGRKALAWIANGGTGVDLWDMKKSAKDVSTIYVDDTGREGAFNYVPEDHLVHHIMNRVYMQVDGFPRNYSPPINLAEDVRLTQHLGDDAFKELRELLKSDD